MICLKKRGQAAAAGAAILLAIIAALLIMFIILIPPQERAELLGETGGSSDNDFDDSIIDRSLLRESPGRIDYLGQTEIEHPLPVVNVFTETESRIIAEKNLAYAKKGVFTEEESEFRFSVHDLQNTKNILLGFTVDEAVGRLIVKLNDEVLYNGAVVPGEGTPLPIPMNLLKQDNVVVFAAASPGIAFWRTHEVSLKNIKVVADVTDVDAQFSKNVFLVTETEKQNLERVTLRFQPACKFGSAGKLSIRINGNEIYDALPDCDLKIVPIEFSPEIVNQGENEIVFRTDKGTYVLSHVNIGSELREVDFPTFYFDISFEEYEKIRNGDVRLRLSIDFVDVVTRKRGDIVFNGIASRFDTKEVTYSIDISEDVVKGNNAVKIKPRKTLEIRELKVDLVK